MSWNGYWDKYKDSWCEDINKLNTTPDEIIIVSDVELDTSLLKNKNVKNIIVPDYYEKRPASTYRNIAVENATSEWIVSADIDDKFDPSFLDDLPSDSDIHGFVFQEKGQTLCQDSQALEDRLTGKYNHGKIISGCSPIKKSVFANIKYEHGCHEDAIFYATASKLDIKFTYDDVNRSPRFYYSGWNSKNDELARITKIYREMISGLSRPVYAFWFSDSISETRAMSLELLKESCKNLVLLNTEEFLSYSHPELPIHKGFQYLHDVHKSDYARVYMMYFYGGGYSDVKPNSFDWNEYFDKLFLSKFDAIGYSEKKIEDVAKFYLEDSEYDLVKKNVEKIIGNCHYIFKPKTYTAYRWLMKIHEILDDRYDRLMSNPGLTPRSGGIHYPIEWNEINGRILAKIQYEDNFINCLAGMPFPNNVNYK